MCERHYCSTSQLAMDHLLGRESDSEGPWIPNEEDLDPEACRMLIDYLFSPEFEAECNALEPHTVAGDATSSSEA